MIKFSQKSLEYKVLQTIRQNSLINKGEEIVVALSGGGDSVCLLDIISKLKDELKITVLACHYNHRLRGEESYNDEEFVKNLCKQRNIECLIEQAPSDNMFANEEQAREARYRFFEKILKRGRGVKVATAHTANDLTETFFLRLIRGSGIRGLRSIPLRRKNFIRPLLYLERDEINEYLSRQGLKFCTDKTNFDTSLSRNFIRHKILPLLYEINPNLVETITNTVKAMEEDYSLIEKLAEKSYGEVLIEETENSINLNRRKWLNLAPSLRMGVLRYSIEKKSYLKDITWKQMAEVVSMIEKGAGDKFKLLPHSLRIALKSGKIIMSFEAKNFKKTNI